MRAALIIVARVVHVRTRRAAYARIVAAFDTEDYGTGSSLWY